MSFLFFSFAKEKDMSFSHRRENDEKSRRDYRLGLSTFCWEAYTHGSKVLQCSRSSHRPPLAVRKVRSTGKLAPAGAKLPEHTCYPFGVFRRGLCELVSTNTCREPTKYIFGSHKRSSRRLAASFRSFLSTKKRTRFSPF